MSRIRVRGIDDGTLVLVNGNPSNYMNHATLNTVPMDQIEKIEVVCVKAWMEELKKIVDKTEITCYNIKALNYYG